MLPTHNTASLTQSAAMADSQKSLPSSGDTIWDSASFTREHVGNISKHLLSAAAITTNITPVVTTALHGLNQYFTVKYAGVITPIKRVAGEAEVALAAADVEQEYSLVEDISIVKLTQTAVDRIVTARQAYWLQQIKKPLKIINSPIDIREYFNLPQAQQLRQVFDANYQRGKLLFAALSSQPGIDLVLLERDPEYLHQQINLCLMARPKLSEVISAMDQAEFRDETIYPSVQDTEGRLRQRIVKSLVKFFLSCKAEIDKQREKKVVDLLNAFHNVSKRGADATSIPGEVINAIGQGCYEYLATEAAIYAMWMVRMKPEHALRQHSLQHQPLVFDGPGRLFFSYPDEVNKPMQQMASWYKSEFSRKTGKQPVHVYSVMSVLADPWKPPYILIPVATRNELDFPDTDSMSSITSSMSVDRPPTPSSPLSTPTTMSPASSPRNRPSTPITHQPSHPESVIERGELSRQDLQHISEQLSRYGVFSDTARESRGPHPQVEQGICELHAKLMALRVMVRNTDRTDIIKATQLQVIVASLNAMLQTLIPADETHANSSVPPLHLSPSQLAAGRGSFL